MMQTPLRRLLAEKDGAVETVDPETTVADAVARMNLRRIGSVLVVDGKSLVGIFSERDVLVRVVGERRDPEETLVAEVMTPDLITLGPDTTVEEAMAVVTRMRRRHLPVVDPDGRLLGLISSGDLTHWIVRDQEHQITDLVNYITIRA